MPRPVPEFRGFIGQKKVVDLLLRQLVGAMGLKEPFPDTALYGPSGVGKTKLASALAVEYGTRRRKVMGHATPETLASELLRLEFADFLFIDEAHALKPQCQELLFHAIDERLLIRPAGDPAPGGRAAVEETEQKIQPCTIVLATDRPGTLCNALHKRMTIQIALEHYSIRELKEIVERMATDMDILLSPQAASMLARASAGIPRKAQQHLSNLRRFFPDAVSGQLAVEEVRKFLSEFSIDPNGIGPLERQYLSYLAEVGSASLESLASNLGMDTGYVRWQVEPLLQRRRLIVIGSRGRMLAPAGKEWARKQDIVTTNGGTR